jgi:hypothetical protein
MHLHVVPKPGAGQVAPAARKRKGIPSPALMLTDTEAKALRASIRNIARARFGTFRKLAAALGVRPDVLTSKRRRPSAGLALAVARVADMSVDAVLGRTGLALVQAAPAPLPEPGGSS